MLSKNFTGVIGGLQQVKQSQSKKHYDILIKYKRPFN